MKVQSRVRALFLMLCCVAQVAGAWAQGGIVENYNVEVSNGKAYLGWTMAAGNTCDGILISRSLDNVNYKRIGEIFGVCGSDDSAQRFFFTDTMPEKGRTNFYRLAFGTTGHYAVQSAFVMGADDYFLYPNPVAGKARLYFDNATGSSATLIIYELQGRPLIKAETVSAMFDMDVAFLPSGVYPFVIFMQGKVLTGKVDVVH